jgi:phosphoketolase
MASASVRDSLFGYTHAQRIVITHTRPESLMGILRPLDTANSRMQFLGYKNRGGTLNVAGMLYANRCSWIHLLATCADALELPRSALLHNPELAVLEGEGDILALIANI